MGRMRSSEKRVENQNSHPTKNLEGRLGELLRIGDVAQAPDTVTIHHDGPVRHFDRKHIDITDARAFAWTERVSSSFGLARPGEWPDRFIEYVRKASREALHGVGRAVHVDRPVTAHRQGANVVDSMNVIGVIVGKENRMYVIDSGRDELKPELGGCVDQNAGAAVSLDEGPDASSFVA